MEASNPYAPPRAAVHDIADPAAPFELAGRGTRLAAAILDGAIVGVFSAVPVLMAGGYTGMLEEGGASVRSAMFGTAGLVFLAGAIAWSWITIVLVKRNGQTIAKKLLGIKVVLSNGKPISLGRIFWLRNFVNALLGMVPFYGLIDPLLIFGEPRRCIHDRIADTIVIKA